MTPAAVKHENPTHKWELITPEMAREYLDLNVNMNRPWSPALVERYAQDILDGRWHSTAPTTPIAFDWECNLINGQNRLRAIIKSNTPVLMPVECGHDPESYAFIDQGKNRDAADLFATLYKKTKSEYPKMHRYVTSVARSMMKGTTDSTAPKKEDISKFAMEHYELILRFLGLMNKKTCHAFSAALAASFCNAALYFGEEAVVPHADRIGTGVWTGERDPMKALSDSLVKAMIPPSQRQAWAKILTKEQIYASGVAGLRAALHDKHISRIEPSSKNWGEGEGDSRLKKNLGQKRASA